jgi:hypothetical protein
MQMIGGRQGRSVEVEQQLDGAVRIRVEGSLDFAVMTPREVYELMRALGVLIGLELPGVR